MRFILSIASAFCLFLSGCAPTSVTSFSGDVPGASAPAGYLVASISAPREKGFFLTHTLFFREVASGETGYIALTAPARFDPEFDFETTTKNGGVMVTRLSPGKYELYNFELDGHTAMWSATDDFSIPFEISAGQTTYIGEYFGMPVWGTNFIGLASVDGFYWILSDQQGRDLAIAKRLEPAIAQTSIKIAVPDPMNLGIPSVRGSDTQ